MKIEITTTKTTKTVKEISLPFYCKCKNHYYKVFNKKSAVQIAFFSDWGSSIDIVSSSCAFSEKWYQITEKEYKSKFNETLEILKSL